MALPLDEASMKVRTDPPCRDGRMLLAQDHIEVIAQRRESLRKQVNP